MEVQVAEDNSVDYRFYSHFVMRKSLAMPARTKMNGITQEVIRRLRNTRATLGWEDHQAPILTEEYRADNNHLAMRY